MAESEQKAKLIIELDDSIAKRQAKKFADDFVAQLNSAMAKVRAPSGMSGGQGSGGNTGGSDAAARRVEQLNSKLAETAQRYRLLEEAEKRLAALPGQEEKLAKVKSEMAGIISAQSKRTKDQEQFLSLLEREANLRRESRQLTNNARGGSGEFSPHSERQKRMLENITSRVGVSGQAAGGIADGLGLTKLASVAGIAAAAVGVFAKVIGDASARAKEFAKGITDAKGGGRLDKLSATQRDTQGLEDALGLSDFGVGAAQMQANVENLLANAKFAAFGGDPKKLQAALQGSQLKGDDKIQLDRTLRDRYELEFDLSRQLMDMERSHATQRRDLALEAQQLDREFYQKRRDLAVEETKAAIDNDRKVADIEKDKRRTEEDFAKDQQKFFEDFEGAQAARQFALERQQAQRDFLTSMSDKQADFATTRGDKQADFAKSESRAAEDYGLQLTEMALSGADAKSYLMANIRYNTERRRAAEDFSIEENRATRDFNRDQGRATRDFAFQEQDAQAARQLELLAHENERRWESIEMITRFNRAMEDSTIALQRQKEDRQMQLQDFANQRDDLNFEENMRRTEFANRVSDTDYSQMRERQEFDINSFRQRRGSNEALSDFAGSLFDKYGPTAAPYLIQNSGLTEFAKIYEQQSGKNITNKLDMTDRLSAAQQRTGNVLQDAAFSVLGSLGSPALALGRIGAGAASGNSSNGMGFDALKKNLGDKYKTGDIFGIVGDALTGEIFRNKAPMPAGPIPQMSAPGAGTSPQISMGNISVNAPLPANFEQQLKVLKDEYAARAAQLAQQAQQQSLQDTMRLLQTTGDARIR
jgi:hypothetical protein